MSMDIDRVNGLLSIVKEASGHPTKLSGLVAEAMRELEGHSAEAKKEHDKFQTEKAWQAEKAKAEAAEKAKKLAEEDAKSAALTSKPQAPVRPTPVVRPASEFKPEPEPESVKRREIPEEATNG